MTQQQQQQIDGFIRKYSQEIPGDLSGIYARVKTQIGYSLFNNSSKEIEKGKALYDEMLKYVSKKIGLG